MEKVKKRSLLFVFARGGKAKKKEKTKKRKKRRKEKEKEIEIESVLTSFLAPLLSFFFLFSL